MPQLRIGIDTGGTFTDVVALDEASGTLVTTKTPTTAADPSDGFMTGVGKVLDALRAAGGDIASVAHGTTVATNALLQGDYRGLGFITTAGFRHVLEIARQSVPEGYGNSYFWVKPERIVPLHLVREVPERMDARGRVVIPFDEDAAVTVVRWFKQHGVAALGICFLNAYVNPEHEHKMRAVIEAEFPDCVVSISSEVLREYREYERSVTTLIDAFLKPKLATYVANIHDRLDAIASNGNAAPPFYVMKSNGGVMSARGLSARPITTVLSGPAAGVLGARLIARSAKFDSVLTLDAGGTSTDVSMISRGEAALTTEGSVGQWPVKVPMVDIVTVGTGGGSIAWMARDGGLKVGPSSAGADPGPMCYGRGGSEPTVTDAHLVLGRIPARLLGGEIALDADLAALGVAELGGRVGLSEHDCAAGMLEIAAWNQANAIRQVTVRRGLDIRDFVMIAFGGSGPLQACRLLDILGMRAAVVPPNPANLSALGLLAVDVRNDYVRTFVRSFHDTDAAELAAVYSELEEQAAAALRGEGFDDEHQVFARSADLRYAGQAFEVAVPAPGGRVDADFARTVLAAFHDEHERLYGYCYRHDPAHPVEWVNLRISGIGPIERPALPELPAGDANAQRACAGDRAVFFDGAWCDATLYTREDLLAGDVVAGPAVIEEFGSTLPVPPGFSARADRRIGIVLTKAPK